MSGSNNDALQTVNAAATMIVGSENRVPHIPTQKKKWGSWWSIYWCFGSQKHKQRIGHAVLVPETTHVIFPAEIQVQQPSVRFPSIAPPSSPASFLHSEPPSCTQSPGGLLSHTCVSANMYSPGPASMFTVGPYAHETQLVSPPVFSTYTTQPSTAPFTPPPESVQFTTPSSPEVPFARLSYQNSESAQRSPNSQYELQSYQLYHGIPVGQLISPMSNSGTSSPFPGEECTPGGSRFLQFQTGYHPKLFNLDRRTIHKWGSQQGSGTLTPDSVGPRSRDGIILNRQDSDIAPLGNSFSHFRNSEALHDPRISFEITAEDVVRCMAKEPSLAKAVSSSVNMEDLNLRKYDVGANGYMGGNHGEITDESSEKASGDDKGGQTKKKHRSATLDSIKEFHFNNTDEGNSDKAAIGINWWANEKVLQESGSNAEWSFPLIQPGVD